MGMQGLGAAAVLAVVVLGAAPGVSAETRLERAAQQFAGQNYEEAAALLAPRYAHADGSEGSRLLGFVYVGQGRYAAAVPLLRIRVAKVPEDGEARRYLAQALLGEGEAPAALAQLDLLPETMVRADSTLLLRGRVLAALGRLEPAASAFRAVRGPALRGEASVELARLYLAAGHAGEARRVIDGALPDAGPYAAYQLQALRERLHGQWVEKRLGVHLGYRLEYDSNVPAASDDPVLSSGIKKEDWRNVLTADLLGRQPLTAGWALFGEVHLYGNSHHQLSAYDLLQQNYLAGIGWSGRVIGLRLPYEYTHDTLDGHSYMTSQALTPGLSVNLPGRRLLYAYLRLQRDALDSSWLLANTVGYCTSAGSACAEDRSGDGHYAGVIFSMPLFSRGHLRLQAEGGHKNADGANWDHDRVGLAARLGVALGSAWNASLGAEQRREYYDNVNTIWHATREDTRTRYTASLAYRLATGWDLRLQGSYTRNDSNIAFYQYSRRVVALGINWNY